MQLTHADGQLAAGYRQPACNRFRFHSSGLMLIVSDCDAAEVHETRVRMNTAHARRNGSLARCKLMVSGPKGPNYWFVDSRIVRGLISSRRANHSFTHTQTRREENKFSLFSVSQKRSTFESNERDSTPLQFRKA